MTTAVWVRFLVLTLALGTLATGAQAEQARTPASTYEPTVGQEGKDVVWVPTPQALVDTMLDMAKVTSNDFVIDLGSGDGRTVITAARRGARALGIEYNPDLVALAQKNAEAAGVAGRARFVQADLFETNLSKASVITMFLLPDINLRLMDRLLRLKPGTRIVSNTFPMGEWEPDATVRLDSSDGCTGAYCTALLWIVPARVAGKHRIPQGELSLKQSYQKLSGTLRSDGKAIPVEGKVLGEEIVLTAAGRELHGRMNGRSLKLN